MSSGKKTDVEGEELVKLIKDSGLFKKNGETWFKIKVVQEPKAGESPSVIEFADVGPRAFMGYAFSDKIENKLYMEPPEKLIKHLKDKKLELVFNSAEPHVAEKEAKYGPDVTYGYYTVVGSKSETVKRLAEEIENSESIINLSKGEEVHSKMTRDILKLLVHNSEIDEIIGCLFASTSDVAQINSESLTTIVDALEMYHAEVGLKGGDPSKSRAGH